MLKSITAALKLSEIRESLNTLNGIEEPTDAQKPRNAIYSRVRKQPSRNTEAR